MQNSKGMVVKMTFTEFFVSIFTGNNLALIGAAVALIVAGAGSCRGVMIVGEAASGVIADDPTKFGKAIVLQALPGTQCLYGFVTAFMVLIKLNVFGETATLSLEQGMFILAACLPIAIIGYISAIKQGRVAAAGINILAKRPDQAMKGVISAALVETYAAFAFLVSLLPILLMQI